MKRKYFFKIAAFVLWFASTTVWAQKETQTQLLNKIFPGFQILSSKEIKGAALIEGHFYPNSTGDFAALIRSHAVNPKNWIGIEHKIVYAGKLVACSGSKSTCEQLTAFPLDNPYPDYLVFVKQGSIKSCIDDPTSPGTFKTDGIGWYSEHMEGVASVYFYQQQSKHFLNCVTSD